MRILPYLISALAAYSIIKIPSLLDGLPLPQLSRDFSFFQAAESEPSSSSKSSANNTTSTTATNDNNTQKESQNSVNTAENAKTAAEPEAKKTEKSDIETKENNTPKPDTPSCNDIEVRLLTQLRAKHAKIEEETKGIEMQKRLLETTEQAIDNKINNLKNLQAEVKDMLAKYEQKQNADINGLVRIYESMKPKDAAKIFDTLQIEILLAVCKSMKEQKLAAVMALMDTERVRELTVALANYRVLSEKIRNPEPPFPSVIETDSSSKKE